MPSWLHHGIAGDGVHSAPPLPAEDSCQGVREQFQVHSSIFVSLGSYADYHMLCKILLRVE